MSGGGDQAASLNRSQTTPHAGSITSPRILSTTSSVPSFPISSHGSRSTLSSVSTVTSYSGTSQSGGPNGDSSVVAAAGHTLSGPVANDSLINKQADSSQSLYQICLNLKQRLGLIPGMDDYLSHFEMDPLNPELPADPVYQVWNTLRMGTPLLLLYNQLDPENPISLESDMRESINKRKADVFKFLKGISSALYISGDDTFLITHLYSDDTNNFVKVIKVVTRCLDELEDRGLLIRDTDYAGDRSSPGQPPKDKRSKVIEEFLVTERKYVQDLEALQEYMRALQASEIVSNDVIHALFLNLNALLDIQRRFLIKMETIYDMSPEKQKWGALFVEYEAPFGVYENFCGHFKAAQDLAVQKAAELNKLDHPLNKAGLGAFLIKPPQRICKYPLLLDQILKATDSADPRVPDLEIGITTASRINNRVNDAIGRVDMQVIVDDLKERVEDWKGHEVGHFGDLLLNGQFTVVKGDAKGDSEREYQIFLFERILLCCKEISGSKKQNKTMSMNKQTKKPRKNALQLKGRIFMQNVTDIISLAKNGSYTLQIFWKGDPGVENFIIRHRNDELLRQWNLLIHKQVDIWKRNESDGPRISAGSKHTTSNTEFLWMNGADLGDARRHSGGETTEDEDEEDEEIGSSAATPMARTDSANGVRVAPGGAQNTFPPPRQPRYPMSNSAQYMQNNPLSVTIHPHTQHLAGDASNASYFSPVETPLATPMGLRQQAGSQQYPFPRQGTPSTHDETRNGYASPALIKSTSRDSLQNINNTGGQRLQRPSLPGVIQSQTITQQNRLRSASSPNIHHLPAHPRQGAPPMPSLPAGFAINSAQNNQMGVSRSATGSPGLPIQMPPNRGSNQSPAGYQYMNSSIDNHQGHGINNHHPHDETGWTPQHIGSAPNSRMQHIGTMHQDYSSNIPVRNETPPNVIQENPKSTTNTTSPTGTAPSSRPATVPSLKVKVSYVTDMFVIIVPQNIVYTHLMDRIERKVRLCGGASYNANQPLRVRYQDEDGDYITVNSDDDVQMAIESRFHGGDDSMGVVTLFVA